MFFAIVLLSLSLPAFTMAVSALFRDKRVILTVGLWLIFLPIAIFNMVIAWRMDDMGNMPFSAVFPLSYLLP